MMKLSDINELSQESFVALLGEIFEHSPWVAELAYEEQPFASIAELHSAMVKAVRGASLEQRLALYKEHPDLATRISIGEYSTKEQQGAGLDRLTAEEFEVFTEANSRYTEKFGFPFLFAVRGKDKSDILAAMQTRIHHTVEEEREEAMLQITKITGFRLHDLITE